MRLIRSLPILAGSALASPANSIAKRAAIDDCLRAAGVPVDARGSDDWNQDAAPFNLRVPFTPVAIVVPSIVEHIQAAVACAGKVGVKVNPKSGGHSYASFGLGGENGHLVVELDRMNRVTVDQNTKVATIQAGARLGHVAAALYAQGQRAISHGTCPGVGIGGHSLHGGFGFSSHTHGLALDWIVGATVVLANATVVKCSASENSDLFWALRGAGSSFGIVASFLFNTFAAPSRVTPFSVDLGWNNTQQTVSGWSKIQTWLENTMSPDLNMRIFGNKYILQLQGMYYGDQNGLQNVIQPLLSQLGVGLSSVQTTDWMGGFVAYANGQTVDMSHPYNLHETFFSKSLVTSALPSAAMNAASSFWMNQAKAVNRDWFIIVDMYGGKNSAIPRFPASGSSYAHRNMLYLYQFYDRVPSGSFPSNGFSFLNDWVHAFTNNLDTSQWGMYINYADPTMDRATAQRNYWRQSLPRLQQIKATVDPRDLFYYPQGVQPAR